MDLFKLMQDVLRYFLLLTPFFGLLMFLALTRTFSTRKRRIDATKIWIACSVLGTLILFYGNEIFSFLGITLAAFRIGVGTILLIDGVKLVNGKSAKSQDDIGDIAIVPMTIPVTVGPATIGALIVSGTDAANVEAKVHEIIAFCLGCFLIWLMLYLATTIERLVGTQIIIILSKLTGLYLASLASGLIMSGVSASLNL